MYAINVSCNLIERRKKKCSTRLRSCLNLKNFLIDAQLQGVNRIRYSVYAKYVRTVTHYVVPLHASENPKYFFLASVNKKIVFSQAVLVRFIYMIEIMCWNWIIRVRIQNWSTFKNCITDGKQPTEKKNFIYSSFRDQISQFFLCLQNVLIYNFHLNWEWLRYFSLMAFIIIKSATFNSQIIFFHVKTMRRWIASYWVDRQKKIRAAHKFHNKIKLLLRGYLF